MDFDYRDLFFAMREAFALHEMLYDEAGAAVDYRFLDGNPAFFAALGKTREEVLGRTVLELFPGTEKYWIERYARVVETGEAASFESYSAALGRWYNVAAFAVDTPGMSCRRCFAVLFFDVTERKSLEEEVRKDEARFRAVVNSMEDLIFTLDTEGRFTAVYGRWFERYGVDKETYIGKRADELIGAVQAAPHDEALRKALRGEISIHECDILGLGPGVGPVVQTVFSPMLMEGKVVGIVGVGRDISEHNRAQRQLKSLLDEKLVLLQEVQHRVKNNLQIIISLIQLQLLEDPEGAVGNAFRMLQSRLYAIASVHDVLSASTSSDRVSLAALLRTLSTFCLSMGDLFAGLMDLMVLADEEITLPVEVAVPVALVVHESLLGRCRAAEPEAAEVYLRVEAETEAPGRCRIRISGAPHPSPKGETRGTLMEGLLDQIKGSAEDDGSGHFDVRFPTEGAGHPIFPGN